ncbi:hypothetical protein [Rhodoferax sp.]|uniref:hypothetical protein n=1 Tax=Rhodoferax sp. TaxID=50421 RepID=UPI002627A407|nr:hypothetical protein [Rhodoferax sp.]MDD2926877.1 hypothetical protein [Rhodoferax sp.]
MTADDGKKEFVETRQLLVVQITVHTPAPTTAKGHFHGFKQPLDSGLHLLGNKAHFRICQTVDGGANNQPVTSESKNRQGQQNQAAGANNKAGAKSSSHSLSPVIMQV